MKNSRTLIIAEAGVNHNGDISIAKKMIDKACEAGCDVVKFQTGLPKNVISRFAEKADYQKKNTNNETENQLEMANKFALNYESFKELKEYCDSKNIAFLSTPFDLESVEYLHSINMKTWKIPSGEITNLPYLRKIAKYKEKVIMSTGMCNLEDVERAVNILKSNGCTDINLLHCTTDYPTQYEDVNLKAMITLKDRFCLDVGYSDHTLGIEVPIAAVSMGAKIIEKHFTLDRKMPGPDHKASLEPDELKKMVESIRNIEEAMGDGLKRPTENEMKNILVARKSIVAKKTIKKGEIYSDSNLTCKRPGTGLSPMMWDEIIGKESNKDYEEDELITL